MASQPRVAFPERRLIVKALLATVVTLLVALPAAAARGGPQEFSFVLHQREIQQPVEQESPNFFACMVDPSVTCDPSTWVYNPTTCVWDVDDGVDWIAGAAPLVVGATVTVSDCLIADGLFSFGHHHVQASVSATSPDLAVTMTNDAGFSIPATRIAQGSGWQYRICSYDSTLGPYQTIPDSNGGFGRIVNYTLTIHNEGRKVRSATGVFVLGLSAFDMGC